VAAGAAPAGSAAVAVWGTRGGGNADAGGGGGGGGSGLVDSSRATVRVARLGGGGRGGVNNRPGQDGSITIAWGPPGQVKAVDAGRQGGGDHAIVPLTSAASGRENVEIGAVEVGALPPLPDVVAVHMASTRDEGPVFVEFGQLDQPFILVLTSDHSVRWHLGRPPPTLRGILVGAYHGRLIGVPEGIPVRRLADVGTIDLESRVKPRFNHPALADQAVFAATGHHVTTFDRDNRGRQLKVPGAAVSFERGPWGDPG
jgi:hypothetical protein